MTAYLVLSAVLSLVLAQAIKIPIYYIITRSWKWPLILSTGGMPSSHSATVVGLSTAVGFVEGWDSTLFVISVVFSVIVMYDAAGVRRHAGYHAAALNQLIDDFNVVVSSMKTSEFQDEEEKEEEKERLKEILGHKPNEVFFGAVFGVVIALTLYPLYF